jgi:hypothetical protein
MVRWMLEYNLRKQQLGLLLWVRIRLLVRLIERGIAPLRVLQLVLMLASSVTTGFHAVIQLVKYHAGKNLTTTVFLMFMSVMTQPLLRVALEMKLLSEVVGQRHPRTLCPSHRTTG